MYSNFYCILSSDVDLSVFFFYHRGENQGGNVLAMPSQAEVWHPTKPLDFSLKTQILANETILSASLELFSQSPLSDQLLSSLTFHKVQKSLDISTLTGSEMLNTEQYKEHALQETQSPKLLKRKISRYPSKTKSTLKCTTQVLNSCSSTSVLSQSHSPFTSILIQCQSTTFPVSSNPKLSLTHPEPYQTRSNTLSLHTLPSQSEEEVECRTVSLDFSQRCFKPANETMLSQSSQSPPSDKLSSFTSNKCQKSDRSAILNSSAPASTTSHQQGEQTLQRALSPRHNDFHKSQIPKGPQSKSAVDRISSLSLSLQSHSPFLSSSAVFPASVMPKLSTISPEDQCNTVYAKVHNPLLSKAVQVEEDEKMLTQFLQSPRLVDFHKPQTPRSLLKTTSSSLDSYFFPQFHGPSPSTSSQCRSPAFSVYSRLKLSPTPSELCHIRDKALTPLSTKSSSQTQSGNTPSQSQPPSELMKSPLSVEQSSSDDEEPYFLPLTLSSSSAKSEIMQSLPPVHLSSSEYD